MGPDRRHPQLRTLSSAAAACVLAQACATSGAAIRKHDLPVFDLPADRAALLAMADSDAALGPGGPHLARSFAAAARVLETAPNNVEAAWRAARALYYQSMSAPASGDEGAEIAERCMHHGQIAAGGHPSAEAHYFMALCMGARAQRRHVEAIGLISKMIERSEAALAIDPTVGHAGPNRILGGIYLRAPAWPTSVGDTEAAIEHLEKAVAIDPDWAENHLLLAEAYLAEGREDEARGALAKAEEALATPLADGWRPFWTLQLEELQKKLDGRG